MGTVIHHAVVATTQEFRPGGLPDMDAFRAQMPESLRPLVLGPLPSAVNGYTTYVFLPTGSKSGFTEAEQSVEWRQRFLDLFRITYDARGTDSPDEVVAVAWGSDFEREPAIEAYWPEVD